MSQHSQETHEADTKALTQVLRDLIALLNELKEEGYLERGEHVRRVMVVRFLGGLAAGLGSVLGATVVLAIVIFLLGQLEWMPLVGAWVTELIEAVQRDMQQR